jgi:hypothetical protein
MPLFYIAQEFYPRLTTLNPMSKIILESNHLSYTFDGENGYKFTITASKDDEFGSWHSDVAISTYGLRTSGAAIKNLENGVEELLRQLQDFNPESE